MIRAVALGAVALVTAALYLARPAALPDSFYIVEKAVPALCLAAIAFGNPTRLGRFIGAGLVASAVGDVILDIPRDLFVPGLLAFLAAHVLYVGAWVSDERAPKPLVAIPFYAYGVGMLAFLAPGLGPLFVPVAVYVLVICTMLWRAWCRVSLRGDGAPGAWAGAIGVIVFAASDSTIALDKFHAPVPHAHLVIMVSYWLGQAGICAATLGYADRAVMTQSAAAGAREAPQ